MMELSVMWMSTGQTSVLRLILSSHRHGRFSHGAVRAPRPDNGPFLMDQPRPCGKKSLPGQKIRNLRDALPAEMLHSFIGRWDRQSTRHSEKHSNGAGHLKTVRGKCADRREEVRLHTDT